MDSWFCAYAGHTASQKLGYTVQLRLSSCLISVQLLVHIPRVFRQSIAVQKHTFSEVLCQPYYSHSILGRVVPKGHAGFPENPGTTRLFIAGVWS